MLGLTEQQSRASNLRGDGARPPGLLSDLRAVVLLAGAVRASPFRRAVGRFVLELPVDAQRCVMDCWHEQLTALATRLGRIAMPVRVIADRASPLPDRNLWNGQCDVRFEQDPFDFRGTGGLLRDLAAQYTPDDRILIANGAQVMFDPLAETVAALGQMNADIAIACRGDGSPTGVMLIRCGCLESVPDVGFIDLNEQALPMIAREHDVRVLRKPRRCGLPIRTLGDYLDALRQHHGGIDAQGATPFSEDWRATFGIVEPGAQVDPSVVVHDSVVLAGARVEAGALLVRSLVCPGATLTADQIAVDCIVGGQAAGFDVPGSKPRP